MAKESRGPAELVMAAAVARRHYLLGQQKVEIAEALGISRFKVARLIDFARDSGMVRIEIVTDGDIDLDRSARLQEAFGLRHAIVLRLRSAAVAAGVLMEQLGAAAADLLSELLTEGGVLGLPWSRSVDVMTRQQRDLPGVDVVQLSGALEVPGFESSAVDIVRRAARVSGGKASIFYAPLLLDDAAGAATLRREPQVARVLAKASKVTVAVMGVGAWASGESTIFDAATPRDRDDVRKRGVVGEIAGVFFDSRGHVVEAPLSDRVVTVSAEHLRRIRDVVALVYGVTKADAVRAALAGGLVNSIIADASLADALLESAPA